MSTVSLDEEQRAVVSADGNLLVLACPGSGKTRALSVRAARLLHEGAGDLCAVSFTRDSAKELKERILEEGGAHLSRRVMSGTFHSLALAQLKKARGGATLTGRLAGHAEQMSAVASAMSKVDITASADEILEIIQSAKTLDGRHTDRDVAKLVDAYDKALSRAGLMDFADMLRRCVAGMRDGSVPRLKVRWLLVDESQDLDDIQLAWVRCHSETGVLTTLVGDDDQCQPPGARVSSLDNAGRLDHTTIEALGAGARVATLAYGPRLNGDSLMLKAASIVKRSSRPYRGVLLTVTTSDQSTDVTPNHRMLVRVPNDKVWYAVLVLGWLNGAAVLTWVRLAGPRHFGPADAVRKSDADWMWMLEVKDSRQAAAAAARGYGFEAGLQVCPKNSLAGLVKVSAENLDESRRRMERLLESRGFDPAAPLINRGSRREKRGGRPFLISASNLVANAFAVPVVQGRGEVSWRPVEGIGRREYAGDVVSLEVTGRGLYVADGIVVHNSIYEWRNALGYAGMTRFAKDANADMVVLRRCYRCAPEILNPASKVIARNRDRQDKALISMAAEGGLIRVLTYVDRAAEMRGMGLAVAESPGEWAVLARTNALLRLASGELACLGVPYSLGGGESLWDAHSVRALLDLLGSLVRDDASRLCHAIVHSGFLRLDQVSLIHQGQATSGGDFVEQLKESITMGMVGQEDRERRRKLVELTKSWETWRRLARGGSADASMLLGAAKLWMARPSQTDNDKTAVALAVDILSKFKGPLGDRIFAASRAEKKDRDGGQADGVKLITLHGSKGLEFPNVWIVGCEDGMVPKTNGIPEEERRLMYVGMTRAKRSLTMSWAMAGEKVEPSRFFAEAGLIWKQ